MAESEDVRLGHGHSGSVDVEFVDNVALVTMRNGTQNRFNATTIKRINAALDQVLSNPNVHALAFTGNGKFFSAGLDLPWIQYNLKNGNAEEVIGGLEAYRDLVKRMLIFPMPTVAVLNGHAAAGGALLSLACDTRIMRRDRGFFYVNEVRIGMHLSGVLKELARTKVPPGKALTEAVIFGKRLTGPETLGLGITNSLFEEPELRNAAIEAAKKGASQGALSRQTLAEHKEMIYSNIIHAKDDGKIQKGPEYFANALTKAKM